MQTSKLRRLLWLLPFLGLGVGLAAVVFDPDYIDPTTLRTQPIGYVGAPVASGYVLNGNQAVFVVDYDSRDWTGNLHSYNLSTTGQVAVSDNWEGGAKAQIEAQITAGTRKIVTRSDVTGLGVPFRWSSLSTTQKTALDPATATTATSSPILDYLRGDHSNESPNGNSYRARKTALGDIIHATPRYWNDGTSETVYVGANDGMLHAINAVDGTERFAFVPSALIGKMASLPTASYKHKYYVDGQLAARKFGSQSILVGGLGGGGMGLFALDITVVPTSESEAASKVLWEITNANTDYANLGHTYGTPILGVLPDGTNVAIVANGYNNTGNRQASLYLINPATGARIAEISTGSGSTSSPNGLSSPTVVDADFDGKLDYAYAGDLDGHLWKFDLSTQTASLLYTTSPAQAITTTPGFMPHPYGGYMITFATGRNFVAADKTDSSTYYAYGIWDRPSAYAGNSQMLTQALTEATYSAVSPSVRVRTATDNEPDWSVHMGWKTALPKTGERVVGDGAFVNDNKFVFMSSNPTVNPDTFPPYENWFMQLNALTGGANADVTFDLNRDSQFTALDEVGGLIPVGRHMGGGIRSQLTQFQAPLYDTFLSNYDRNGDAVTYSEVIGGVAGGHFDFDIYQGKVLNAAKQATATIVVGTGGQVSPFPATLGAITVDGVVVVPPLTVSDIVNGTASTTNATTIRGKVTGGFTVTQSGSTLTIMAPPGAGYNGKALSIAPGTSQDLVEEVVGVTEVIGVEGEAPTPGTVVITDTVQGKNVEIKCGGILTSAKSKSDAKSTSDRLDDLYADISGTTLGDYGTSCSKTVDSKGKTSALTCTVSAAVGVSACPGGFEIKQATATTNIGPQGGIDHVDAVAGVDPVPQSGWTDFKPALSATNFTGGADGTVDAICSGSGCKSTKHVHEYDDLYNVTGVNMLDASEPLFDLSNAIPSQSTRFKVLVQNQYLSPAVELHLNGAPGYVFDKHEGYIPIKTYMTSPTLDLANVTTYTRGTTETVANGVTAYPLRSFAVNMPVDAFVPKNWWDGALIGVAPNRISAPPDVRVGLHPTQTGCVKDAEGATDGNMYEPVIPPATVTADGNGTLGYSSSTTALTATGVRHNGALVIQIIKDTTPNTSMEMSVPDHPEYGWRVKSADYGTYVLAEYTIFWHHPNGKCYGATGWTKLAPEDTDPPKTPVSSDLGTDPKIGELGASANQSAPPEGTTTVTNEDGSTTTTTVVYNDDGTYTTTVTTTWDNGTVDTTVSTDSRVNDTGGAVDELGKIGERVTSPAAVLGRVNWRELLK